MRYWLVVVFIAIGFSSNAQQGDIRAEWGAAKKLKLDAMGVVSQFPALIIGYEYPLKDQAYAVEHELGAIFSAGSSIESIQKTSGLVTNHTFLLYGDNRNYIFGLGAHFKQLNISGDHTICVGSDTQNGDCAFFRLFDEEPLRVQRLAPYLRLRRMTYLRNNITFSFGVDLGRYFQRITNDIFDDDSIRLETRIIGLEVQRKSGIFFRAHAQFNIKI